MRKTIIACALLGLLATAAWADPVLVGQNKSGGQIVLTDDQVPACPDGELLAFASTAGGEVGAVGCWQTYGEGVVVKYADDKIYFYRLEMFEATGYFKRQYGDAPAPVEEEEPDVKVFLHTHWKA